MDTDYFNNWKENSWADKNFTRAIFYQHEGKLYLDLERPNGEIVNWYIFCNIGTTVAPEN
jgi:hypothetical protein